MGRGTRRHGVVLHAGLIGPWPGERRERHFHDPGGFRGFEHPKPSVIMNQASAGMSGAGPGVAAGMPAVVIATAFGGPEVLSVTDQPTASPGPGQARVEVRAAGVNPIDWKAYSGSMGTDPARLPMRLGAEAAGVVTAVGPGASGVAGPVMPGDEVIAFRVSGAYAAELVVPAQSLVPKPPALDWPQAAGLMVTGAAAWHTLVATGVGAGDTVLIHRAASMPRWTWSAPMRQSTSRSRSLPTAAALRPSRRSRAGRGRA